MGLSAQDLARNQMVRVKYIHSLVRFTGCPAFRWNLPFG
jgi:hypothetical protein